MSSSNLEKLRLTNLKKLMEAKGDPERKPGYTELLERIAKI